MRLTPGQQLGHYRIEGKIGEGGMGTVHRATDTRLGREVAIKVLPAALTTDDERRQRFRKEAQLAASFNHPNLAIVHDVGEQDGVTFIVMELLRGDSLRTLVERGPLELDRALEIATGVAAGLARAHDENVLHRDLKPDNVVLTDEGVPKILDFGLSKLVGVATESTDDDADDATVVERPSQNITRPGEVLGTLTYMSPEQVQGWPVDARTDVFSFGVVLYELLAGKRPFAGGSFVDTASRILRDEPEPLDAIRPDAPEEVREVLARCLAKPADDRYASAREVHAALVDVRRRLDARDERSGGRVGRVAIGLGVAAIVLVIGAGAAWFVDRNAEVSWARNEALPEIERLFEEGDQDAAIRLLRRASAIIPDDPFLEGFVRNIGVPLSVTSDPPGATIYAKGYGHPEREWMLLGEAPLEDVSVPTPTRFRVEKEGYVPFEGAPVSLQIHFRLFREDETPEGMVFVGGGPAAYSERTVQLGDFWIDQFEVTNREYKLFVDDGGYRNDAYWDPEVDRSLFVDATGRPGPAAWELGAYPEGDDDLPVGGVSWYEASAYAAWAGKSLPTIFHWKHAAQQRIFSEILRYSNFESDGPAPVGVYDGLGPHGTYDMAGNLREWCINANGEARYILGGAWSEPDYLYRNTDSAEPTSRLVVNGFRCIRTDAPIAPDAAAEIAEDLYDHREAIPIDDASFELLRPGFDYDARALDPIVEARPDGPEPWRHQFVTVTPAYGDERLQIHLFLPEEATPPYQAVVYFPPSSALILRDSTYPNFPLGQMIPMSGRALIFPIYQGTYERIREWRGPNDARDRVIQMAKDLRRSVDYLLSRDDIDGERIAYYGLSLGAHVGPIMTAVEPRFATSILVAGGLYRYPEGWPPEAQPLNFLPRVEMPTLMVNGNKDFGLPIETNVQAMFDRLGVDSDRKRLVVLEGGHVPESPNDVIRAVLDWLDRWLGEVSR